MGATENNELEYQIIETAKQLFIEKGFVETSMSDIAAKVGISRPTLLFQDKRQNVSGCIRFDSDVAITESTGNNTAGTAVHRSRKSYIG